MNHSVFLGHFTIFVFDFFQDWSSFSVTHYLVIIKILLLLDWVFILSNYAVIIGVWHWIDWSCLPKRLWKKCLDVILGKFIFGNWTFSRRSKLFIIFDLLSWKIVRPVCFVSLIFLILVNFLAFFLRLLRWFGCQ